jgi:hypothetical protein
MKHTPMQRKKGKRTMHKELHEENRVSWNAATVALNSHKGDPAAFFRQGGRRSIQKKSNCWEMPGGCRSYICSVTSVRHPESCGPGGGDDRARYQRYGH